MNHSMEELLALWEEKEGQCTGFKSKLDSLTQTVQGRDAHIEHLKGTIQELESKLASVKQGGGNTVLYHSKAQGGEEKEEEEEESQEVQLASQLDILQSKISQGERQLAELEREIREKGEEASVAESLVSAATTGRNTASSGEQKRRKSRIPRPKLLSRFKR
jgi:chromosome segregation ATPase